MKKRTDMVRFFVINHQKDFFVSKIISQPPLGRLAYDSAKAAILSGVSARSPGALSGTPFLFPD
jgi:hypothetical protein